MSITIHDFFKPIKIAEKVRKEEYYKISPFIQFAESLSQVTYQSVYLFDYHQRGFAYVSDNPLFLCGRTSRQVKSMGYSFYFKHVPTGDLELLLKINALGFAFFNEKPVEDRLNYSISYDFHLQQSDKRQILVNHKLVPLILDKDANIWIALCVVSLSPNTHAGNIIIRKRGGTQYRYDLKQDRWQEVTVEKLSNTEKLILMLSGQGLTVDDIAEKLHLSVDTIKFHRKTIFRKLQVKTISGAITAAEDLALF